MKSATAIAKKIRETPDARHSRADIEALHAHVIEKLLEQNPKATNADFLDALMRATHTKEEYEAFHREHAEHTADHERRMKRRAEIDHAFSERDNSDHAVAADIHKLAQGLALIAEAIGGSPRRS